MTVYRDGSGHVWNDQPLTDDCLRRCAENEGLRAVHCVRGHEKPETAYYFAREAAHYALMLSEFQPEPEPEQSTARLLAEGRY